MSDTFGDFMIGNAVSANKRIVELEVALAESRAELAECQEQFRARVDASDSHDRKQKQRIRELESQVEALSRKLELAMKVINSLKIRGAATCDTEALQALREKES